MKIKNAMMEAGTWSSTAPTWVIDYEGGSISNIWQWLQFIYLPLRELESKWTPTYLAPVLARHIDTNPGLENFLQLVIELDSMIPTIQ